MNLVKNSYKTEDVEILLKDLSGDISPLGTDEREKLIQSGVHYSEMLPKEYKPSDEYMKIYKEICDNASSIVADAVQNISEMLYNIHGDKLTLISFARAGIPAGILIKRYLKRKYSIDVKHYAISIIRGRGIDVNAMNYIAEHCNSVEHIQFVDGWTGKGAILHTLADAVDELCDIDLEKWIKLSPSMAVIADPAHITTLSGTWDDIVIPSCCLNSTVSGLISRTVLNESLVDVDNGDFHGAVYYEDLEPYDLSYDFIDNIERFFDFNKEVVLPTPPSDIDFDTGYNSIKDIASRYGVNSLDKIKPGIGETTRVLLRRVPWTVLISDKISIDDANIKHIIQLCKEKKVPYEKANTHGYYACGIIKDMSADL